MPGGEFLYQKKENYGRTRTVQSEQKRINSGYCGKQYQYIQESLYRQVQNQRWSGACAESTEIE